MDDKTKKRAATGAVALLTAASILVSGSVDSPSEILGPPDLSAQKSYVDRLDLDDDLDEDLTEEDEDEEKGKKRTGLRALMRDRLLRLPLYVRLLIVLPLWALGSLVTALLGPMWGAFSPALGHVLRALSVILAVVLIFLLSVKTIFPDLPVKKLLNKRTLPRLLGAAALLAAADLLLLLFWEDYPTLRETLSALLFCLVSGTAVTAFSLKEQRRRKALAAEAEERARLKKERRAHRLTLTDAGGDFTLRL